MTGAFDLPVAAIYANPRQPRKLFDDAALRELAASIVAAGLLQAIRVRPDDDGRFMIVVGERRWRAFRLLERETIPATVTTMSDDEVADAAIIENLARKDITPLEEARAFQARLDAGLTEDELARRIGLKQPWRISERTNLLKLSPDMQDALARGLINAAQALEMSRLKTTESQAVLFRTIRDGRCRDRAELFHVTRSLEVAEQQVALFAVPAPVTAEERTVAKGLGKKIAKVEQIVRAGFKDNEVIILRKVNPLEADVLADKLEVIETALRKLRYDLRAAAVHAKRAPQMELPHHH